MKKIISLLICITMLFLCACSTIETPNSNLSNDEDSSQSKPPKDDLSNSSGENSSSSNTNNQQSGSSSGEGDEPPIPYEFNTYDEFKAWFAETAEAQAPVMTAEASFSGGKYLVDKYENFREFADNMISGKWNILVSYRNGEIMDDIKGITVMPDSAYSRPWIWTTVKYGNRPEEYTGNSDGITFRHMYLTDDLVEEAATKDILEFLLFISNGNTTNSFHKGTIVSLELMDKTVSALQTKLDDESRVYLTFIYDNLLIRLVLPDETFMGDFLKEISFSYYK